MYVSEIPEMDRRWVHDHGYVTPSNNDRVQAPTHEQIGTWLRMLLVEYEVPLQFQSLQEYELLSKEVKAHIDKFLEKVYNLEVYV